MAVRELDARVAALEAEVAQLKQQLQAPAETKGHWVDRVYGAFANDPDFLEAMRLGRKYRESLRSESAPKRARHAVKRKKR